MYADTMILMLLMHMSKAFFENVFHCDMWLYLPWPPWAVQAKHTGLPLFVMLRPRWQR